MGGYRWWQEGDVVAKGSSLELFGTGGKAEGMKMVAEFMSVHI